jgi:hypothetical protein
MTNNKEPEFTAKITKEEAIRIATQLMQNKTTDKVTSVSVLYEDENQLWVVIFNFDRDYDPGSMMIEVDEITGDACLFHNF